MELQELENLAIKAGEVLVKDLEAAFAVKEAEVALREAERLAEAQARADGTIDGKNADTRKAQLAVVLTEDARVASARQHLKDWEFVRIESAGVRAEVEAQVSLTKAWLYSQARVG